MKKILLTSVAAVMVTIVANAKTAPYVSIHAGYTKPTTSLSVKEDWKYNLGEYFSDDFAYDVSGAVGIKFDISSMFDVRAEAEYDFVNGFVFATSGVWQRSHTTLFNAYLDLKNNTPLTPYIGGGIGYQWNHSSEAIFSNRTVYKSMAYQIGTGFAFNITDNLSMDLGYRYLWSLHKFNSDDGLYHYHTTNTYHQFRIGAMYAF